MRLVEEWKSLSCDLFLVFCYDDIIREVVVFSHLRFELPL